ncbi:hypothetical protein HDU76_002976 [Blyttiomyces sp. JEL0837]|nr:hypothetical protein HDU76_002976 [Blyttiomyces sp. JEL0837]
MSDETCRKRRLEVEMSQPTSSSPHNKMSRSATASSSNTIVKQPQPHEVNPHPVKRKSEEMSTDQLIKQAHKHVDKHLPISSDSKPYDQQRKKLTTMCQEWTHFDKTQRIIRNMVLTKTEAGGLVSLADKFYYSILKPVRALSGKTPNRTPNKNFVESCQQGILEADNRIPGRGNIDPDNTYNLKSPSSSDGDIKSVRNVKKEEIDTPQNCITLNTSLHNRFDTLGWCVDVEVEADQKIKYIASDIAKKAKNSCCRYVKADDEGDFLTSDDNLIATPFDNKELLFNEHHDSVLNPDFVRIRAAVSRVFHAAGLAGRFENEEEHDSISERFSDIEGEVVRS